MNATATASPEMSQNPGKRSAMQAIAAFEATKGVAVLAGLIGVLDLLHRDVRAVALALIGRFGLDPDTHYPSLMLHYAELLPDTDVHMLVAIASAYIALRFIEATGLWLGRAWGEYLGALSGGIYIPFEVIHLIHDTTAISAFIVILNAAIVGYLTFALWQRHQHKAST